MAEDIVRRESFSQSQQEKIDKSKVIRIILNGYRTCLTYHNRFLSLAQFENSFKILKLRFRNRVNEILNLIAMFASLTNGLLCSLITEYQWR